MSGDRQPRTPFVSAILTLLLLGIAVPATAHGPASSQGQTVPGASRGRGEKLTTDLVHLGQQYQAAAGSQKSALEQGMVAAAQARKQEMLGLLASDPGEFLRLAVPGRPLAGSRLDSTSTSSSRPRQRSANASRWTRPRRGSAPARARMTSGGR